MVVLTIKTALLCMISFHPTPDDKRWAN